MSFMSRVLLGMLIVLAGCSSSSEQDNKSEVPDASISIPVPRNPIAFARCTPTKIVDFKDCTLYDVSCGDGTTDMMLICPNGYIEMSPPMESQHGK